MVTCVEVERHISYIHNLFETIRERSPDVERDLLVQ